MAHLMTLKVLVDDVGIPALADLVATHAMVIDSAIIGCDQIAAEMADSIVNETYSPGDAFKSWVLFSPSADAAGEGAYWSEAYGWGDVNLATRYDPYRRYPHDLPDYGPADSVLMIDPTLLPR